MANNKNAKSNKPKAAKKQTTNKNPKKMTNKQKAEFSAQNQIDWYPVDPYCD